MKSSIWRSLIVVLALLLVVSIGQRTSASQSAQLPGTITDSQGNDVAYTVVESQPYDDLALFPEFAAASYYHIPASVLVPVDHDVQVKYGYMGCIYTVAGAGYLLNAPLEIPDGSQLVGMRMYYYDTSTTGNASGWITLYHADGSDFEDLLNVVSSGSSGRGDVWTTADDIIDAYNYSYVINARFETNSSTEQICGFRVMYYPPNKLTFLPNILKDH